MDIGHPRTSDEISGASEFSEVTIRIWSRLATCHVSQVTKCTCDGIIPSKVRGPITALRSLSLCRLFNAVYGHSLNIQFMGNSLDSFTPS